MSADLIAKGRALMAAGDVVQEKGQAVRLAEQAGTGIFEAWPAKYRKFSPAHARRVAIEKKMMDELGPRVAGVAGALAGGAGIRAPRVTTEEDLVEAEQNIAGIEKAQFDMWVMAKAGADHVLRDKYLSWFPEIIESREEVMKTYLDMAMDFIKMALYGVNTPDDLRMLYQMETGKIPPQVFSLTESIMQAMRGAPMAFTHGILGSWLNDRMLLSGLRKGHYAAFGHKLAGNVGPNLLTARAAPVAAAFPRTGTEAAFAGAPTFQF